MGMKITISGNFGVFAELLKRWPSLQYSLMSHIGYAGRRALYKNYLQGQVINLQKYRFDDAGHRTVNYAISKNRQSVKISSYPLNLYNPTSVYNSATSTIQSSVNSALSNYDEKILQKRLNKIDRETK